MNFQPRVVAMSSFFVALEYVLTLNKDHAASLNMKYSSFVKTN